MRLRRVLGVLTVAALIGVPVLRPDPAAAQKVANPGPVTLTAVGGNGFLGAQTFSFDPQCGDGLDNDATPDGLVDYPADPKCTATNDQSETQAGYQAPVTLTGSVAANGAVTVPRANFVFPPQVITDPLTVTVTITANSDATGTMNPLTGAVTISSSLRIDLDGIPLSGANCRIDPLNVTLTTGVSGTLVGVPYDTNTGQVTVVANDFTVPTTTDCGLVGGTIDSTLGLPIAAGNAGFALEAVSDPVIGKGVVASVATTPDPVVVQAETDPVTFDASASYVAKTPASYRLDPGNGDAPVTQASPVFSKTYMSPGNFTASVRVSDPDGDNQTVSVPVTVNPRPPNVLPEAVAGGDVTNGFAPLTVNFSSAGSNDPDGTIVSRFWTFGDGGTSSAADPSHTYLYAGNFTARLTVTDDRGGTDFADVPVTVTAAANNQDPTAAFTFAPAGGTAPQAVGFDARGSFDPDGDIVGYNWDFGDSTTGGGPTPIHVYTQAGIYAPTLTVADDSGGSDVNVGGPILVLAGNAPPRAWFSGPPPSGAAPVPFCFHGWGSSDDSGITSYEWAYGDGTTGTGQTPTHTYTTPGSYTATLTVRDAAGVTDTDAASVNVDPGTPSLVGFLETPAIRRPGAGSGDVPRMSFYVKTDPGVSVTGVKADFDWDGNDNTSTAAPSSVTVDAPAGGFNYSRVVLAPAVGDPGGWDCPLIGSGVRTQNLPLRARFALSNGTDTDSVSFTVTVNEPNDCFAREDFASVYDQTQSAAQVVPGGTVNFSFKADDPDCDKANKARWRLRRLNDGYTTSETEVSISNDNTTVSVNGVVFPSRGLWLAEARIGSLSGGLFCNSSTTYQQPDTYFRLGTVEANTAAGTSPTVALLGVPGSVARGQAFTAIASTGDSDSEGRIQMVEWDVDGDAGNGPLGDGYEVRQVGATEAAPALELAQVVDTAGLPVGARTIRVRVTDNGALNAADPSRAQATASVTVNVENVAPVAAFVANPLTGKDPTTVLFTAAGSADADGTVTGYGWDWDGDSSVDETTVGPDASHVYGEGTYAPELTVTDDDGATTTVAAAVPVVVGPENVAPTARASVTPTSGGAPLVVNADALDGENSSTDSDGTLVSYGWDWGDGNAAEWAAVASHTYQFPGTYTVTLTVKDDDGATDTTTAEVTVENVPPVADFSVDPPAGDAAVTTFAFDGSTSYDPNGDTLTSFEWDFDGDGGYDETTAGSSTTHVYAAPGLYLPVLRVTDSRGATGTFILAAGVLVSLPPNVPPVAALDVQPASAQKPAALVTADAGASTDTDLFGGIDSYEFNWGDGTPNTVQATPVATHLYTAPSGIYDVTVTVTDNRGATDDAAGQVQILAPAPDTSTVTYVGGGATAGTATVSFSVNRVSLFGFFNFYIGGFSLYDTAADIQANGLVLAADTGVTRYGLNGAQGNAFAFDFHKSPWRFGTVDFKVDDLGAVGEGADTVDLTGQGPFAGYSLAAPVTTGDLVVLP